MNMTHGGISIDQAVCGGDARAANTRIPVWILVRARQLGADSDYFSINYPTLNIEDLENAWKYYDEHRKEIDEQIAENEDDVQ